MGKLFTAGENIHAGYWLVKRDLSDTVVGLDPVSVAALSPHYGIAVGTARENIREGFRIYVDEDGNAREDDA